MEREQLKEQAFSKKKKKKIRKKKNSRCICTYTMQRQMRGKFVSTSSDAFPFHPRRKLFS